MHFKLTVPEDVKPSEFLNLFPEVVRPQVGLDFGRGYELEVYDIYNNTLVRVLNGEKDVRSYLRTRFDARSKGQADTSVSV